MSYSPINKYIIKELVSSISFISLIGLNLGMLRVAHAGPHPYSEPQIVAQKMNQESLPDFIAYSMKKLQEKADALSTRIFDEFNVGFAGIGLLIISVLIFKELSKIFKAKK